MAKRTKLNDINGKKNKLTNNDDNAYVSNMTAGELSAENGNDIVKIEAVSGGVVRGNNGDDKVRVGDLSGEARVHGGHGNDIIRVGNVNLSEEKADQIQNSAGVHGAYGDDIIRIGTLESGNIYADNVELQNPDKYNNDKGNLHKDPAIGNDIVRIGSMEGGNVYTEAGDDKVRIGDLDAGNVFTGDGNDRIVINSNIDFAGMKFIGSDVREYAVDGQGKMTGGEIHAGLGNDFISVEYLDGGKVNGAEGDDIINVETLVSGDIRGDYHWTKGGVQAGADKITVGSMQGGTIHSGGVNTAVTPNAGDVITVEQTMSNGTIYAGNGRDKVTIGSKLGAGQDAMLNGVISGQDGMDTITVNGNMKGGNIFGGNDKDTITINGNLSANVFGQEGNDTLRVEGTMTSGAVRGDTSDKEINREGAGADNIYVNTMEGGVVNGNFGNDKITIDTLDITKNPGGYGVFGGQGVDTINIGTLVNGYVTGTTEYGNDDDGAKDIINVTTMLNGTVRGGAGNDVVTVDNLKGGVIYGDDGNDTINIKTQYYSNGDVYGGEGRDTINVYNTDYQYGTVMKGGLIDGGAGGDFINIDAISGGEVRGGAGNDSIDVRHATSWYSTYYGTSDYAKIYGDEGNDTIKIGYQIADDFSSPGAYTMGGNALVDGGIDNDDIYVRVMNGGTVLGGEGNDEIFVGLDLDDSGWLGWMKDGTISGGNGNDNIVVKSMKGGVIYGDAGKDEFHITSMEGGNVQGGNGIDTFYIGTLSGGYVQGSGPALIEKDVANIDHLTDAGRVATEIVNVKLMTGGSIETWEGGNEINVDVMEGGIIQTDLGNNAGDDTVTIAVMKSGKIYAGEGEDTFIYNSANGATLTLNESHLANRIIIVEDGIMNMNAEVYEFENLGGGAGMDSLTGNSEANKLYGYEGNDYLHGMNGDDTLYGGAGDDRLIGGAGMDTFVFEIADSSQTDTVTDFEMGVDILDLTAYKGSGYNLSISPNNSNTFILDNGSVEHEIVLKGLSDSDMQELEADINAQLGNENLI